VSAARRVLATTTVLVALLAAAPAQAASYRMDGTRRKSTHYAGILDETSVPFAASNGDPRTPALADCTERSCDIRELQLTLPRGTSWGRFYASVRVERALGAAIALYDAKGSYVTGTDALDPNAVLNTDGPYYTLTVYRERMRPGRYTFAIVDRGGTGGFEVTAEWVAHPPDRRKHLS
jgi:hypothetical protein